MSRTIGIIGPADLVERAMELMKSYPRLSPLGLPYATEQDTMAVVREHVEAVDAFLFTGYVPYRLARSQGLSKPLFYFSIAGASLSKSLFHLHVYDRADLSRVSIDTISRGEVEEMYHELGLDASGVYINRTPLERFCAEDYFQFHLRLHQGGKTSGAVTSMNSVAERLKGCGVPVQKLTPTPQGMRHTLRLMTTFFEGEEARGKQLVYLLVQPMKPGELDTELWNDTARWFEKENKRLQASVLWNSHEIIALIDQRVFDRYTDREQAIPLIQDLRKRVEMPLVVGIGMGDTMLDAEENARASLKLSRQNGAKKTFIINQNKEVVEAMTADGISDPSFRLMSTDAHLVRLAQRTNLSVKTLSKVKHICADSGTNVISSKTIEDGLGITLRSANRILTKLVEAGVAVPKGYEDPVGRGRPRVLYSIDFNQVQGLSRAME
ncbi:MAG: hypothetical protein QM372_05885 [Bacillota bacterium]|jgi:hypothetical protein|nr:hypothetical protein [Bacillota bacterium]